MKALNDFFTIYKESAWDKDSERMIELYHRDVVIFDMWNQGYQNGLTEWSAVIQNWLGSLNDERVNVIFDMVQTHESGSAGFASAVIMYQAMSDDKTILRSMKNRITVGFTKSDVGWKVVHQHTSAPIKFDLQAILDF